MRFCFVLWSNKTGIDQSTYKSVWKDLPNWHNANKKGFPLYRVTNNTFMDEVNQEGNSLSIIMNVIVCDVAKIFIRIYYQKCFIKSKLVIFKKVIQGKIHF